MAVLEARKRGTPTVAMTVRLDAKAHKRLQQYALYSQKTMSLAMDEVIFNATKDIPLDKKRVVKSG